MRYKIGQTVITLNKNKGKVVSIEEKVNTNYKPYIVVIQFKEDNRTVEYNYSYNGLFLGKETNRQYPLHLKNNVNYLPDWF